jgi:catechol 2,3-dioxygenase-like lactoylglutathione lyase family enzyme
VEYHFGRLIDHVHLVVSDLDASKAFYRAALQALGREISGEDEGYFYADELFVSPGDNLSHVHLAFQTQSRDDVHRFYQAALGAGGVDNGAPGERQYHPGYYAAYVFDPDGNNIEAVYHGSADRSAASIVVTPKE